MKKLLQNRMVISILQWIKPVFTVAVIFLFLRYSGLLTPVQEVTGQAVMKTGLMDFEPDDILKKESFDYNFSIRDMNGNTIDFSRYKGKVVFLNLWATWCGPCRFEMPSIQSLYNSVPASDSIAFVMLSLDRDGQKSKVVSFIKEKEYTFPVFMPAGQLPEQLRVPSIPTTFVISRDGKIIAKEIGASNYDTNRFKKFLEKSARETTD